MKKYELLFKKATSIFLCLALSLTLVPNTLAQTTTNGADNSISEPIEETLPADQTEGLPTDGINEEPSPDIPSNSVVSSRALLSDNYFAIDANGIIIQYTDGAPQDVVVPDAVGSITVKGIAKSVFQARNLTSVTFETTALESIGDSAFYGNTLLPTLTIPSTVTSMGNNVFQGCTSLTSATILGTNTSIDTNMFNGCTKLQTVVFNNTFFKTT